jgi:metal-responsive CopG/Arc/MetJ family transcriptional regulator
MSLTNTATTDVSTARSISSVVLPANLARELASVATEHERSVSGEIRVAIRRYISDVRADRETDRTA